MGFPAESGDLELILLNFDLITLSYSAFPCADSLAELATNLHRAYLREQKIISPLSGANFRSAVIRREV